MIRFLFTNYVGRLWSILSGFIFVPFYIKYLGFESYSIIAFMLIVSSILMILDSGFASTLSREFARKDVSENEKKDVYQSLEAIYLLIFALVIVLVLLLSDFIAINFIKTTVYTPKEVSIFIKILSLEIGCQMLFKFYLGGIIGLERHIESNIIQISWGLIRNVVVIIPIMLRPDLNLFFTWQTVSTLIFTLLIKMKLNHDVYSNYKLKFSMKFDKVSIQRIKAFTFGMLMISLVAVLNTQLDKLLISKFLDVASLGYYTLGVTLSMGIIAVIQPISVTLLPRFTKLFSNREKNKAKELFEMTNGVATIIILTFISFLYIFAENILILWTGNEDIAMKSYKYLMILSVGNGMVALQLIPYCIAISNGNTYLNNMLGIVSLFFSIPSYYFAITRFGAIGAAIAYSTIQFTLTIIYLFKINRIYFKEKFIVLFGKKILLPFFSIFLVLFIFSTLEISNNRFLTFIYYSFSIIICISLNIFLFHNQLFRILILKIQRR